MIPPKNSKNLFDPDVLGLSQFLFKFIQDDLVGSFYLIVRLVFYRGHLAFDIELL